MNSQLVSIKLHGYLQYQKCMPISEACYGGMAYRLTNLILMDPGLFTPEHKC